MVRMVFIATTRNSNPAPSNRQMSNWIILNIEPSLASVGDGERVPRLDLVTYTLQEMVTGQVKKLTCSLSDRWADTFLTSASPEEPGGRPAANSPLVCR